MSIVLICLSIFFILWLLGVATGAYHVFKYRLPGDVSVQAFWIFVAVSAVIFLVVIYFISGINWGNV